MKEKGILLLTVLLTGALVNSAGFVFAETNSTNSTESTSSSQDEKVTICHIPPGNTDNPHTITISESALDAHLAHGDTIGACDGGTGGTGGTGATGSTGSSTANIGNFGQYVSEFVREPNADFKQQRAETIEAIKDCRADVRNADNDEDRKDAQEACKEKLKEIREKYKAQREEYRQLFKQYRDSMKILINEAKGHGVSEEQKEKAMKHIDEIKEMKEKMKEQRQAIQEQMKEEKQATKDKKE